MTSEKTNPPTEGTIEGPQAGEKSIGYPIKSLLSQPTILGQ
jgi:hypothetical protein